MASSILNGTYLTHAGYDLGERGTVGLTVRNLLDRNPLLDDGSMVNEYIYDLSGRVVTLTYSVEM